MAVIARAYGMMDIIRAYATFSEICESGDTRYLGYYGAADFATCFCHLVVVTYNISFDYILIFKHLP